ncbi:NUDIX hydrolase [Gordonia soli]|uniref:Putative 8-oxo-dGTP diphosphatase n=1 Tax=Gordonia soli NBRC 108243 TaxID=1223545 RepID=M0QD03_9ACTN|nr:NUDIX hydrolase [Gordonia soli]GAC66314.1 putative 8-oxo-dGTP diphosphatase [Gordonia soli NBRC 108243]
MSKNTKTVWAAGGVLWRPGDDGRVEVGLVHRPRYDDWTLPKGKADPGETMVDTAVRELREETGYDVRLGRHLRDVAYDLPNSTRKRVRYWSARAVAGQFHSNHEVDELRWLSVADADTALSYRLDKKILREFDRLPADLDTLLVVRHAKAGRRSRYRGDDRLRPLDRDGRRQAEALVPLLSAFGAQTLYAADRVRCRDTLEPLRRALDVDIIPEPDLSEEAYAADPTMAHRRIRRIAEQSDTVAAVCSQGKVIPPLMRWWSDHDGLRLPSARNRKGSVWVVSLHEGRLVAADHIDSPLPDTDHGELAGT